MKSLEDLNRIREEALKKVNLRQDNAQYRVLVGMATCGIAAGARPVMKAFLEGIEKDHLPVTLQQTGCIGMCIHEPIVEIIDQASKRPIWKSIRIKPRKSSKAILKKVRSFKLTRMLRNR